jgi:hypothetical protein
VGQERLGPSFFFTSLVLGPLNSLLWYAPSSRYIWSSAPILFLQEQIKDIIIIMCDSETTLDKVSRWIGSDPRTTLAGDANADIMKTIIECVSQRVIRGARR